jgi:serine/threonine protein phosphatase PrpC
MATRFIPAKALASSRQESEDRAEVFEIGDVVVVALADGAGGVRGGAAASDALINAVRCRMAEATFDAHDLRAWSEVFKSTDIDLATGMAGETTAVVTVVSPHGIMGISAGDSEAWVLGLPGIDRLTENQDRQRLGSGRARPVVFHRRALDGMLVVGTDGLFKNARPALIAAAATEANAGAAAERLVSLPRASSGRYPDDVAVVVVAATA